MGRAQAPRTNRRSLGQKFDQSIKATRPPVAGRPLERQADKFALFRELAPPETPEERITRFDSESVAMVQRMRDYQAATWRRARRQLRSLTPDQRAEVMRQSSNKVLPKHAHSWPTSSTPSFTHEHPIAFQSLLPFEQAIVDAGIAAETAKLNAKLAARAKREAEKRQAEIDKSHRPMIRDHERRQDRFAVCGIIFYSTSPHDRRRSYWTHCHRCGKALTYYPTYAEAQANNGECKRR